MSSERFRLTNLSIEGFRGTSKQLNLSLNGLPTIIYGSNGVGKTSILQAIEWGLYDRIPHMTGAEFDVEDAIVNQFHPDETARVELTFESPTEKIRIIRTREKTHWSRRKSRLVMEVNGATFKGKEAQAKIEEIFDLTEDEFYASRYMHQEALNEFIIGDPNIRSAMIDRMLGTYSLRELIDSLPINQVTRRCNETQSQIQALKSTELQNLPLARAKLEDVKKKLLQMGIMEKELDIGPLPSTLQELAQKVEHLAEEIDIYTPHIEMPPQQLTALQEATLKLRNNISLLERERFKRYRELNDRRVILTSLRDQYKNLLERLQNLNVKEKETLEHGIHKIEEQIAENETKRREVRELRDFLQGRIITLTNLQQNLKDLLEGKEKITSEYGDIDSIQEQISNLEEETNNLRIKIGGLETYSQTITSALEFIRAQKPDVCPVCKRSIDPHDIEDHLQKEIAQSKAGAKIAEMKKAIKEIENRLRIFQKIRIELDSLDTKLKNASSQIDEQKKKIAKKTRMTEINLETLKERLDKAESEIKELESSIDKLTIEKRRLENDLSNLNEIQKSIGALTEEIHREIGIEEAGLELLKALTGTLEKIEEKIGTYDSITRSLEELNVELGKLENILTYLTQQAEVLRLEQEFPELETLLKELTDKHHKLRKLEAGLEDIKQAILTEQKNLVIDMIREIESEINQYYSRLLGHAYYVNLELSLETHRDKNIYWIKAKGTEYETHIQTRFSNAQLNITAIAIFISMSKRLSQQLNIIILDDPTQSMDPAHKQALANMLAVEAKEKQVIVATQEEEFKKQLVELIQPNKTLEITDWSTEGPIVKAN